MLLVSILGDFHSSIMPIFYEFKELITKHILIHDNSQYDIKQLSKILKGREFFLLHYKTQVVKEFNKIDFLTEIKSWFNV